MTVDQALIHADEKARIDALDVERSFIVQAPAGSGKTELLIQRYLKLLGKVSDPEEILAITFTRKAAAEMQLRVLDALRLARAGDVPEEPHRKLTNDLAKKVLARSEELGWNLIGSPRRMRIQTLDALNRSVTRAQPLSSPEGTNAQRIVTDADLNAVHEAAAVATLDWLAEEGPTGEAIREVLSHIDNNTWSYVSYISAMLKSRDQWLPFIGTGMVGEDEASALRSKFETGLEIAVSTHLERLRAAVAESAFAEVPALFGHAVESLAAEGVENSPILALDALDVWPGVTSSDVPAWQGVAELLLLRGKAQFRKSVTKAQGFPTTDRPKKDQLSEMLVDGADDTNLASLLHGTRVLPPAHYSDQQWSVLLALLRLLPVAVSELKRLFGEQGIADHIEIALNAGAALGSAENPGDIALLLDYKVSHILVDEMQDTSSAQYRMLEALTGGWADGDGRTLFCVGDPMQSIYRFRNAEVGQFLLAREFGIGRLRLESLLLRRNFRSGSHLVDWFNRVFPDVLAAENDPQRGAVSYSEAVAAPHLEGIGDAEVHPVFGVNADDEALVGCTAIQNILAANPDDELAILVRGRTQLPGLLAALRSVGVAYTAVEIDKLTDLPEIIDVLALTRAAVHPADRIAWLGVLRAPWIGLDWSDLLALVHSDSRGTVYELLNDPERLDALSKAGRAAVEKARPALDRLLTPTRSESLRERVERCWFALGGPGAINDATETENVYRFLDLVESHESGGTLTDVARLESILDDQKVSSGGRSRIQVMTMHKAKGLEFDHVLLYGLGRKPGGGNPGVLSWFDIPGETGSEQKIISPIGSRKVVDRDPIHRYIAAISDEKDAHEQGRLLYVACTRAQKSLHLVGNVSVSADGGEYRAARTDSLLHLLWPFLEPEYARAFDDWTTGADGQGDTTFIEPVLKRFEAPWTLPDVPSLTGHEPVPESGEQQEDVEFYWVGTEARIAGTLAHRWLQVLADASDLDCSGVDAISRRWLREMGIGGESAETIIARVQEALDGTLGDERGRWLLATPGHAELALTGVHDGEVESVVLDRVCVDENGDHWIVDYKTSTHEGGNLAGFLDAETRRYTPQLEKYAAIYEAYSGVTPRRALYFPLLREFVEIQ